MKPLDVLRALGPGEQAPADAKQRVYGALQVSLAASASAPAPPKASASLPPPSTELLSGIAGSKALLLGAGIWLMGGATGAALYEAFHQEQVRVVYVDRPVIAAPARAPTAETPRSASASAAPSSAPIAGVAHTSSAGTASSARNGASDLARERELLDRAREHAAHGEPALVLEAVARHRQQFPRGRLSEERDALGIRALLALGRGDEARASAAAFHASYPSSFLTPVIDAALSAP